MYIIIISQDYRKMDGGCFAGSLAWLWPLIAAVGLFAFTIILIIIFDRQPQRVANTSKKT